MKPWMASPVRTSAMYLPSGPTSSRKPTLPTVHATSMKTPMGVSQITQLTSLMIAANSPSNTRTTGFVASPPAASASPSSSETGITPNVRPPAASSKMFRGTIWRRMFAHAPPRCDCPSSLARSMLPEMSVALAYSVSASPRNCTCCSVGRSPGRKVETRIVPIVTAISIVTR